MHTLWLDLETRSGVPADCGAYRYAEDSRILLFSYAVDDAPARVWDVRSGEAMPPELAAAIGDEGTTFIAHNSNFDRTQLRKAGYAFAETADRWKDSMVLALSVALPASLGALCEHYGLPADKAKDKEGKRLIKRFCIPGSKLSRAESLEGAEERDWVRFREYARLDVEAMREVWARLPKVNDTEAFWREWRLDQRINDRGIRIDTELVKAAMSAVSEEVAEAEAEVRRLTDGAAQTTGQRDVLLGYLRGLGVCLPDFTKGSLEDALAKGGLPEKAERIIRARLLSGKASTKKFWALDSCVCGDGRIRGTLQFCGASRTGRMAGRLCQPQNLPRGSLHTIGEVECAISALKAGVAGDLYDEVSETASSCLRGCIVPSDGKRLVVADLSNIEGRTLAWLAGEEWKLEAFRLYDRGEGPDLYKATYARTFGVPVCDVTKAQRQVGKVMELALGYQGGADAFHVFADTYGMDLDALVGLTKESVEPEVWESAEWLHGRRLEEGADFHGMSKDVWVACDAIKRKWRAAHPAVCAFWSDAEAAVTSALHGVPRTAGRVRFGGVKQGLCAVLPSGRVMFYPKARLEADQKGAFRFWGPPTAQMRGGAAWRWLDTYGGRIVENCTQAVARDIIVDMMRRAESAGFAVVSSVHDELLTEADAGSLSRLTAIMSEPPRWADGLPLSAAGFEGLRYRKD